MLKTDFSRIKKDSIFNNIPVYLVLLVFVAIMLFPLLWALFASLKSESEIFTNPLSIFPKKFMFKNYVDIFKVAPFHIYFVNSVKITLVCTFGTLFTSAMAAYAFARLKFPGRNILFLIYLATLMVPRQITLVPTFVMMRFFGLLDNHLSLILPGIFSAYGTFLLRQFFLTIPMEYEEQARIDGCGTFRRFFSLILPLAQPGIATLGVLAIMAQWNDFLYPMVFLNTELNRTLTMGLAIFRGDMDIQWNLLMAGVVITSLPLIIIFLSAQRFFIEGISMTGLKG